jgi:hypothetical protein
MKAGSPTIDNHLDKAPWATKNFQLVPGRQEKIRDRYKDRMKLKEVGTIAEHARQQHGCRMGQRVQISNHNSGSGDEM